MVRALVLPEGGSLAYADGSPGIQDEATQMSLLRDREPHVVLKIGTYNGTTTRLIVLNQAGAKIHILDLPRNISSEVLEQSMLPKEDSHRIAKRRVGEAFVSDPSITSITHRYGDSSTWNSLWWKDSFSYSSTDPTPIIMSDATPSAVHKRQPGGPRLSGTTSTITFRRCRTLHRHGECWTAGASH